LEAFFGDLDFLATFFGDLEAFLAPPLAGLLERDLREAVGALRLSKRLSNLSNSC
jgi:hypothetical protein